MFDIPEPQMPSLERQREWGHAHLAPGRPFRIDAWPAVLRDLAGPLVEVPLTPVDIQAILTLWGEFAGDPVEDEAGQAAALADLEARLTAAADFWAQGVFVRLNTRSPKDNFTWLDEAGKPVPVFDATSAVEALAGSMGRIHEDLSAAELTGDPAAIVLRPFQTFEPWREVRIFIEGGQVAGISQYFYRDTFPEVAERAEVWEPALRATLADLIPQLPWPAVTLDGWLDDAGGLHFLEVNPPVTRGVTDPALFDDRNLDGTFRWRRA